jgi:thiamine pyrophosphate-dependent acetolactate synthase large subunit-like protein
MTQNRLLKRREAVAALLAPRETTVVVTGLGAATYDTAAAGDHDRNFYLWGAMGGATALGLGLALAQPETPVLVINGDGEAFMGLGSFTSLAQQAPGNLTVVVLDNGLYGETGAQETPSSSVADLAAIAKACGIADATTITTQAELKQLAQRANSLGSAPTVAVIKISPEDAGRLVPIRDGAYNKSRLRVALGLSAD